MRNLFEYLLESLVDFKELKSDLIFKECSWKDIKKILNTDEYSYKEKFGFSEGDSLDDIILCNDKKSIFYKLIYKGDLLGITGVYYFKNRKKSNLTQDIQAMTYLFKSLRLRQEYKYDTPEDMLNDTAYILIWQLSNKAKEKLDVNPVALVKVFYEKLIEMVKAEGCKVICAHGKDDKVTKSYIKVGGFESYGDKYANNVVKIMCKEDPAFYEHFVIKKI